MRFGETLTSTAIRHPRLLTGIMAALTLFVAVTAAAPSLFPQHFPWLNGVAVDTDPENMLSHEEPVRLFHDEMKRLLTLYDMIVIGVVNDEDPNGVFNPESLQRIHDLTQYAKTLHGAAIGEEDPRAGVVEAEVIAPSTVDNIEQAGLGTVRFEWLMPEPPKTQEEALAIRDKARRLPFLNGTLLSEDGKAIALYLPLTSKDLSYRIYSLLRAKTAEFDGADQWHITGLPVAEDTFGVEMFIQMAISAPLAMLVIFLLLLFFFRKMVLILSPMIIALASVILTMGMLVITGNTIHIMSSMIPIFIMPIAVLDSVHILSEFFDRYQATRDRRKTITHVMDTLFAPMLFTSLTSAAGFASLALTPIPPVQVFGIFVAMGVLVAWLLTVVFIPAYVMLMPERAFANFGLTHKKGAPAHANLSTVERLLHRVGEFAYHRARLVLFLGAVAITVAFYGISLIQVNDNPTRWFRASHPIRVADRVLNEHFGGTYMAYLSLNAPPGQESVADYARGFQERLTAYTQEWGADTHPAIESLQAALQAALPESADKATLLATIQDFIAQQRDAAEGDAYYTWDDLAVFTGEERQRDEVFKQPEALAYIAQLQTELLNTGVVGKSNSLTDIVKTVHRELFEGSADAFRIPDSAKAVAQTLITFEGGHRPGDLFHFVTPDYRRTSLWVQLQSGDNKEMSRVAETMAAYMAANPPPFQLVHEWFGLTYINVVWQEKMVTGMLQSFLGSFLVVLLMMTVLFRSGLWGLISMIPLTITVGLIYGVVGIIGKDYDMPVAVLSSLTLGLAVDFAIHFLARARALHRTEGSWAKAHGLLFGEPARAISRNVIVIAVGFLPLLAAPLRPYNTVGVFLASILVLSGAGTLLLLPALIRLLEPLLFPKSRLCCLTCSFGTMILTTTAAVALVAINVHQFFEVGWKSLSGASLAAVLLLGALSALLAYRQKCRENSLETQETSGV